ncbi:MAG: ABC transporter permease [Candidatus Methanoperedenaceae archaeon]|nr:MAG: ABC transporter permease [Candidatus Methanoperedenaceae archaeon]
MILKNDLLRKDLLLIIILILWEAFPRAGLINPVLLPAASTVSIAILNLLASGEMFMHISISLKRALAGFILAVITMVPLGLAMGWFKNLEEITDRLVQACRQTSALALFPMFILLFGIGELSKVVIIFWASLWPILLNTINGVKNVDTMMIKASISMGASDRILLTKVLLPAAAPSIFTGIRLGASYALMVLVAAEMIGANSGLGFLIINSQEVFRIPDMYAAIFTLAVLGILINYLLIRMEKKITGWKEEIKYV